MPDASTMDLDFLSVVEKLFHLLAASTKLRACDVQQRNIISATSARKGVRIRSTRKCLALRIRCYYGIAFRTNYNLKCLPISSLVRFDIYYASSILNTSHM